MRRIWGALCLLQHFCSLITTKDYSNISDSRDLNVWIETDDWQCNAPLVQDHLTVSLYQRGSSPDDKALLLYGGSFANSKYPPSDETWSFSLRSKVWSRLATLADSERPSGRIYHSLTTLCRKTVVLFGGKDSRTSGLNDTWIFESGVETWKRPVARSAIPIPGMFRHGAVAVDEPISNCSCNQSVLVLSDQAFEWSSLWQLRCIRDRYLYEWSRIEVQPDPKHGYPKKGRARLSVSVSLPNESAMIAIAVNGLWKYCHLRQTWTLLGTLDTSRIPLSQFPVNFVHRAAYVPESKTYVIFGGQSKKDLITFSVAHKNWTSQSALGSGPIASIAAVIDQNTIIVYGGVNGDYCHQSVNNLISIGGTWVWLPSTDISVSPNMAPQRVLGEWQSNIYVCGVSHKQKRSRYTELQGSPHLWKLDTTTMQWWKLGAVPKPATSVCNSHRDNYRSVRLKDDRFVVFGSRPSINERPTLHVYFISENTWRNQTTLETPPSRMYHSMASYNKTAAFLFGGLSYSSEIPKRRQALNDLWMVAYWGEKLEWMRIDKKSKTSYPTGRMLHTMVVIQTELFIYGGWDISDRCIADFWRYNVIRDSWTLVEPENFGPVMLSKRWTMLATTVGKQLIVTAGCFSRDSNPFRSCNATHQQQQQQETWLYSLTMNKWMNVSSTSSLSDIVDAASGPATNLMFIGGSLFLLNTISRPRVHYMLFACPKGYFREDTLDSCLPCPHGQYSSSMRDKCQECPHGLTTRSSGMNSMDRCIQCVEGYCRYGACLVTYDEHGVPAPDCRCVPGFIGTRCSYPTYFLIGGGLIIVVTAIVLLLVCLVNAAKRKRLRERKLQNQVEELLSVWQIGNEEITFLERIGLGASGKVYKAVYREAVVAVKVLNVPDELDTSSEVAREIRFMQTIRHPNIVMFLGAGRTAQRCPFLVTEFMPRGSLLDVLEDETVPLSLSRQLRFAIDAAKGLNFLHTSSPPRIHRDVKSANLLVSDMWMVKVADFGLGRQIMPKPGQEMKSFQSSKASLLNPLLGDERQFTRRIGTVKWRAPELSTTDSYNTAVDVYSFGIVLWEICTRQLPFAHYSFSYEVEDAVQAGERPPIPVNIMNEYSNLMESCWEQEPNRRPSLAAALLSLENMYSPLSTQKKEDSSC